MNPGQQSIINALEDIEYYKQKCKKYQTRVNNMPVTSREYLRTQDKHIEYNLLLQRAVTYMRANIGYDGGLM
jgi:hypothetical protein